jgi:hypothetical protein
MSTPLAVRTSTHEVLPPKRTVAGPGFGIEPRVPQKRMRICPPNLGTTMNEALETERDSVWDAITPACLFQRHIQLGKSSLT